MDPLTLPLTELAAGLQGLSFVIGGATFLTAAGMLASLLVRRLRMIGPRVTLLQTAPRVTSDPAGSEADRTVEPFHRDRRAPQLRAASQIAAWRLFLHAMTCVGVLSAGTLMVIEYRGAEPLLKFSLNKLQDRTGISLTFERATGGPLSGEYRLHGVRIRRDDHTDSNFDLAASEVTVRFTWWKMCCSPLVVEGLQAQQITGSYHRIPKPKDEATKPDLAAETDKSAVVGVLIRHLEIRNAAIDFTDGMVDGSPIDVQLVVDSLDSAPFRTGLAAYDIIFRSDIRGTLDGKPFRVHSTPTDSGRRTEWSADGISIGLFRTYVGGPFRWLLEGTCDVRVTQDLSHDPRDPVVLNTKLSLRELRAGVPANVKPAVAVAVEILSSQIKNFPKQKELQFKVELDPENFDLTKTEDQHRAWEQFRQAMVGAMLQTTGLTPAGATDERSKRVNRTANEITEEALKVLEKIRERRKEKKAARKKQSDSEQ